MGQYRGQDRPAVEVAEPVTQASKPGRTGRFRLPRIHTFDSLASKDFRLLFAGSFFDNMAIWLQLLSLTSLVYDLTGSAMYAGLAGGLRGLPTLVIGPWAGVAADRIDRRMLVLVSQVLLAVAAAGFVVVVFLGAVQLWHALAYAAVSSICFAFIMPIRQALVVNTTPPGNLGNAYALSALTITVNRFLGGLLFAGLLLLTGDIKWNFVVEGVAYLVTAALLVPMRTPYAERSTAVRDSVLNNLKEGLKYIWTENRIILHLIILSMILTWVFLPVPVLLAPYASQVLELGADTRGYLLSAQGVGGITATLGIATLGFGIGKGRLGLIALVSGCTAVLVMAQSHWLFLSLGMLVIFGISQSCFIVSNNTLVQGLVPDTLRGRITSIYMFEHGLGPVAVFVTAVFMDLFGVAATMTVVASVGLASALYFLTFFKQVRNLA